MYVARYADLFAVVQKEVTALIPRTLSELALVFYPFVPAEELQKPQPERRKRIYTAEVTFWAFLWQALGEFGSCREAVQKVVAMAAVFRSGRTDIAQNTSAYCQARARLDMSTTTRIGEQVVSDLETRVKPEDFWKGRKVRLVDGSGITLEDTSENQKAYPQSSRQRKGCGFPVMKILGCFSLETGALCRRVTGTLHQHDMALFVQLWPFLAQDDVVLGDRAFCSYAALARLNARGVDCVFRLHSRRATDFRGARRLGQDDYLVTWTRPKIAPKWMPPEEFLLLPETLTIRIVRISVEQEGCRTRLIHLATTLLDAAAYTYEDLAELYRRRWQVELCFRDIKTTMGMERLSCRTPRMIEKEMTMRVLAYNLIRALIFEAASTLKKKIVEMSFQAVMELAKNWSGPMIHAAISGKATAAIVGGFLRAIAACRVYQRPNRHEPRAIKRRLKNYQLLTKPRHAMKPTPHRGTRRRDQKSAEA